MSSAMIRLGSLVLNGTPRIAVGFGDAWPDSDIREAAKRGVDIAEVRIDQFRSFDVGYVIDQINRFSKLPTIATIRSPGEGGSWTGSESDRLALFKAVIPHVDAVDIELCSEEILADVVDAAHREKKLAVISFHELDGTPELDALLDITDKAADAGADIVKIATQVNSPSDVGPLAELLVSRPEHHLIVIGMGGNGVATRLLFPSLGSLVTFAYLGKVTAPGQLHFEEMCDLMRRIYPSYNDAKLNELKLLEDA